MAASAPGGGDADADSLEEFEVPPVPKAWAEPLEPPGYTSILDNAMKDMDNKIEAAIEGKGVASPEGPDALVKAAEDIAVEVGKTPGLGQVLEKQPDADSKADAELKKLESAVAAGGFDLRGAQQLNTLVGLGL